MSGHSKWATIKRKKAATDAVKGKIFTQLAKDIILAAKIGGGDPEGNFRLKSAIAKAKEVNMPNENIQRAIAKGTGTGTSAKYEEIVYEGYGPGGVAIMMEIMTDNRNRTAGEIRFMFSRNGGSLGESGCVSWMFEKKGLIFVEKGPEIEEDDLLLAALDAGAEDVKSDEEDVFEIITGPDDLEIVREALETGGYKLTSARPALIPKNLVKVGGEQADQVVKLLEVLEEHDDVQEVYSNFDIEE